MGLYIVIAFIIWKCIILDAIKDYKIRKELDEIKRECIERSNNNAE